MRRRIYAEANRSGITVLGLLLLIIALVVAAFFLIRYLRSGPGPTSLTFSDVTRPDSSLCSE